MAGDAAILVGAYLLGSIPFSFLVARFFGVADVRRVGSGNVGATNVLRTAGKKAGMLAFVLDALKGAAAAWLAGQLVPGPRLASLAAVAAVLGHMYPVWLRFQGGKGVATGAGAFLPILPLATVIGLLVFGLVAWISHYVSLGSIAGAVALAIAALLLGAPPIVTWCSVAVAVAIVVKHRSNLSQIVAERLHKGRPKE
jgi:glycerol-3-phosphate acyltransferase PlsY